MEKLIEKFRQDLYAITDLFIINYRASDAGNLTPQDRDRRNMEGFNRFLDSIEQALVSQKAELKNECLNQYGMGQQEGLAYAKESLKKTLKKMKKEDRTFIRGDGKGNILTIEKADEVYRQALTDAIEKIDNLENVNKL